MKIIKKSCLNITFFIFTPGCDIPYKIHIQFFARAPVQKNCHVKNKVSQWNVVKLKHGQRLLR